MYGGRRLLKVLAWTVGMAAAVILVIDGKSNSPAAGIHLLGGALVGLVLGIIFSRKTQEDKTERD